LQAILETPATYPLLLEADGAHAPAASDHPQQQQQPGVQHLVQQERRATTLLSKGNLYGLTALHMAVCKSHAEAVQVLLEVWSYV
jgi:hypothetical protein